MAISAGQAGTAQHQVTVRHNRYCKQSSALLISISSRDPGDVSTNNGVDMCSQQDLPPAFHHGLPKGSKKVPLSLNIPTLGPSVHMQISALRKLMRTSRNSWIVSNEFRALPMVHLRRHGDPSKQRYGDRATPFELGHLVAGASGLSQTRAPAMKQRHGGLAH